MLLIAAAPVGFLSVPHWINAALFLLAILLPIHKTFLVDRTSSANSENKHPHLILLVFLAPIVAVLLGQSLRGAWQWSDYDAPARLLLGLVVYTTLSEVARPSALDVTSALAVGLVLALAVLPLGITTQAVERWGGRLATNLSDTNTFGSYVGLMVTLTICLIVFFPLHDDRLRKISKRKLQWIALIPIGIGIWALIGSQSRGAWIASAGALFTVAWIRLRKPKARFLFVTVMLSFFLILEAIERLNGESRLNSIFTEFSAAFQGGYIHASVTSRLEMYSAALDLASNAPLTGFGDLNYRHLLGTSEFMTKYQPRVLELMGNAGPHSELLGRTLQSGVWGLGSACIHLGLPTVIFWKNQKSDGSALGKAINSTGLILMAYLILVQFSIEFTLKHTASFNALILALLLAVSVKSAHDADDPLQKSN